MSDSRDFQDAESVRSRPLSRVPSESALLASQADQGGLLSRPRNLQPDILDTHGTKLFGKFTCILFDTLSQNTRPMG